MTLKLTSSAFQHGGPIPSQYTCEGRDISPPIAWAGAPQNAKSFALIVDDPDAPDPAKPQRVYVHWVVYNIPTSVMSLSENASKAAMPAGAVQGKNDWGKQEYGGPCPPVGDAPHRYVFTVHALDVEQLDVPANATAALVGFNMHHHLLGRATLTGRYGR